MGRPRKLPDNVIRFVKKDDARNIPRAEPFKQKARRFNREMPPQNIDLIFEYMDADCAPDHPPLYTFGWYDNGKPVFYYNLIDREYQEGKIRLLSWRLSIEWQGGSSK